MLGPTLQQQHPSHYVCLLLLANFPLMLEAYNEML
jgi:hypothetical protein